MHGRRVIISADDFGLSEGVNEGVEQACRDGMLTTASLMVAGPAAPDAIRRARRLPQLRVGLHLVVIDGDAMLPGAVPDIVDGMGRFPNDQLGLGIAYFARPRIRRQLRAEIAAQFRAFRATGVPLDHANAHKHMHLHPTVGRLMIEVGAEFGLRAMRVPAEPPDVMRACGAAQSAGDRALYRWTRLLRAQGRRAGLRMNDQCFGIAWSGHMTADRILRLAPLLPPGLSEIYFHPATGQEPQLQALMPGYQHGAELDALMDPRLRAALAAAGAESVTYGTA